jgi:tetratricopeptide (TPR) repeat protein
MSFSKTKISILTTLILVISVNLFAQKPKKGELTEAQKVEFTANYIEANKNRLLGNFDVAEQLYASCLKIDKRSASSYYDLATIYMSKNELDKAIDFAKVAILLNAENHWYKLLLANLYQKKGMLPNSAEVLENIVKTNSSQFELYYDLASIYIQIGNTKDAIKTLNIIEKQTGISEQISLEKERIYTQKGEFDKSIIEIERLITEFPTEAKYLGILAELYMAQKNYEKANEMYKKLLAIDPNNGNANLAIADYYRLTQDKTKMMEHLKKAFACSDVLIDAKIKMLVSFYSVSNHSKELSDNAYVLLNVLLETYPAEPKVHTIYADYLVKDAKYEEAEKELELVTKTVKDKYMIWEQLLSLNSELKHFDKQFANSSEAIEYFPTQAILYLINGISASELKKYTEAISSFNKGLEYVFDDKIKSTFYVYLGEANHNNGTHEASDEAFDNALKIDPKNVFVLNNYSYYLSERIEKLEKASGMSKKTIELEPENYTFLDTYAWILFRQNKFAEAKPIIEKSIELGGNKSSVIVEHYGDILFKLNEIENAVVEWKKALELDGKSKKLEEKISSKKLE